MTAEQQTKLLTKGVWDYTDVMAYFDVKKTKAYAIIADCRKLGGATPRGDRKVLAAAVFEYFGLSREKEIQLWRGANYGQVAD